MNFKKLALVTAIAAVPVAGFSLEAIEDEALSGMTGQDGIQIDLYTGTAGIAGSIYIHDQDGLNGALSTVAATAVASASYSYDGAIVIQNFSIGANNSNPITINIDAGDNALAASAPILNVEVLLPAAGLTIVTGTVSVANSQRDEAGSLFGVTGTSAVILNTMTIVIGGARLNIQLGNEAQIGTTGGTDMMVLSGSVTGGVSISSFRLNDATTNAGALMASSINIHNSGDANLTLGADINMTNAGLEIGLNGMGTAGGMTVDIENFNLGTSTNALVGDISIVNLNVTGARLVISGK